MGEIKRDCRGACCGGWKGGKNHSGVKSWGEDALECRGEKIFRLCIRVCVAGNVPGKRAGNSRYGYS